MRFPQPPHASPTRWLLLLALAVLPLLAACQSDEEKIAGFLERGEAYVEEGKLKEAIIEYRNVVQLDPNHPEAHYELAKAYIEQQKLKEAFWELSETVRIDPENVEARLSYGALLLIAKDWDQVLTQAEAAMELDATLPGPYLLRAQALEGLDRAEEAEADYRKAVELAPDEHAHLILLASYLMRHDRPDDAEEVLYHFTEVAPGFESYSSLARFQGRADRDPEVALDSFRKALELATPEEELPAYKNLAGYLFQIDRPDEAVAVLE